jgi:hypothetical protein
MAAVTFVRGASRDEEVEFQITSLFRAIPLPVDVAARAREIIAQCVTDRWALPSQITERQPAPTGDGAIMIPGLWARTVALHAKRDVALRSLLEDPAHVRAFDENAAAEKEQFESVKPTWAT